MATNIEIENKEEIKIETENSNSNSNSNDFEMQTESSIDVLASTCNLLNIDQPSTTSKEQILLTLKTINQKLKGLSTETSSKRIIKPNSVSPTQLTALIEVSTGLEEEYQLRRQSLIKRFQVTLQSLQLSITDKQGNNSQNQEKLTKFNKIVEESNRELNEKSQELKQDPALSVYSCLLANNNLINEINVKISSKGSLPSVLKDVQVGNVPDRGGRPKESRVNVPEFKERVESNNDNSNYNNNNNRNQQRGSRVQGAWRGNSNNNNNARGGNWNAQKRGRGRK
eukprot:TRINITY_DN311_c1_g1_i1.p1 TRINITY_DN311_c1_g1~~TRINITY_DN311_c1_g1_i1.p1  ORF type:complete len:283 (-),score=118.28 TRINITY_DN311_c1_g1_i1:104-952(-)